MKPEIDLEKLTDEGKSYLLAEAENGIKPSETIVRTIEREARRRGYNLHVVEKPNPKKSA